MYNNKGEEFMVIIKNERLLVVIIYLMSCTLIPSHLYGSDNSKDAQGSFESDTNITLAIEDGLITLNAIDASLKEIIENIGNKMDIEVVGNIANDEIITLKFEKLSIEETLKKLTTSYGYVMDSELEEKSITRIIVLPKGIETVPSSHEQNVIQREENMGSSQPEPLKFEFDPSKFIKKDKE